MGGLLSVLENAARETDKVIVGFSCGKDGLATLILCRRYFKEVQAYFLYLVSGLEFQERYLRFIEGRFEIDILRLPHPDMAIKRSRGWMGARVTQPLEFRQVEDAARAHFGIEWIATGERMGDSLQRRGMINKCRGIDAKRRRLYPLAGFNTTAVMAVIKQARVPLSHDYKLFGRSFDMWPEQLAIVKREYPADWARILAEFPFIEAYVRRAEFTQAAPGSEGHQDDSAQPDRQPALQSAHD